MKETNSHPGSTAGFDHQPGVFPFADYRSCISISLPFYYSIGNFPDPPGIFE
jgi:hypothetical protein